MYYIKIINIILLNYLKIYQIFLIKTPWLIGMRNRLIHAYFDVDCDIVWKTAKEQLPLLKKQLEEAIFLEQE